MSRLTRADAVRLVHRNRTVTNGIVLLGDSLTYNNGRNAAQPTLYNGNGFWNWAQFLGGHPMLLLGNLGVTGEQTTTMAARLNDVVSLRPGWVHILAGTNDVNKGIDIAQTIANLTYLLDYFESAGIRILLGTIPPQNTLTTTGAMQLRRLNSWIRQQPKTRRTVIVVDYYAASARPDSGIWAGSGFLVQTNDGVHPNPLGAYVMGKTLANVIKAAGIQAPAELFGDEADITNVLLNSQFQTGGTSATPTGWNASTPTGSGTATFSKANRTDGVTQSPQIRQWQQILLAPSVAGAAVSMTWTNANIRTGSWAIGDSVSASIECMMTALDQAPAGVNQAGVTLSLRCLNGGTTLTNADDLSWAFNSASYPNHTLDARQGVFRTPPMTIPAGTTSLSFVMTIAGGGTYNFDRAGIQNLSRYGLSA